MNGVIDIHPHVISRDVQRYPRSPLGGRTSDWSETRPVTTEQMVAAMNNAGIDRAVLVQASTCYGHDNSYVADSVAAQPRRFTGVFSVDMLEPEAPERIRYWKRRGFAGLRVFIAGHTLSQEVRLDDPRAFPAWQCAVQEKLPICVQLRAPALGQLQAMLEHFPAARIVLDHMERPEVEDVPPYAKAQSLFNLAVYPNLYLKLTTHNVRDARQGRATPHSFLSRVIEAFGVKRIAWGSNYPASEGALPVLFAEARAALAERTPAEREWIFSRTAHSLYPAAA